MVGAQSLRKKNEPVTCFELVIKRGRMQFQTLKYHTYNYTYMHIDIHVCIYIYMYIIYLYISMCIYMYTHMYISHTHLICTQEYVGLRRIIHQNYTLYLDLYIDYVITYTPTIAHFIAIIKAGTFLCAGTREVVGFSSYLFGGQSLFGYIK